MKRGDVVTVAASGDYGKPRPAVVITNDILLAREHGGIAVCQFTSTTGPSEDFRITIEPTDENGLKARSDLMVDKPVAVSRRRIGSIIGHLSQSDIKD